MAQISEIVIRGPYRLDLDPNGNLGIFLGGTEVAYFDSSGNLHQLQALDLSGAATLSGNTSVGGTLTVSGAATLSSTLSVSGATTFSSTINPAVSSGSLSGTTAGTVTYFEPFAGSAYKKVVLYFSGYENDTTTNQTITYPTAFSAVAAITFNNTGLTLSTSTTTLTITAPDSTTTYTGLAVVEGY